MRDNEWLKPTIFVSYAHEDEALKATFTRNLVDEAISDAITLWDDRRLEGGRQWEEDLLYRMEQSPVIFLLVTDHFLSSQYCMTREVPAARRLYEARKAHVLVIRLSPCTLDTAGLQSLPSWPDDGRPLRNRERTKELFDELRLQTKKWLVERLKQDEENLALLHATFGVQHKDRTHAARHSLFTGIVTALLAVLAGPILPPTVEGILTAIWLIAPLFFVAGAVRHVSAELLRLYREGRGITRFDVTMIFEMGGLAAVVSAVSGILIGLLVGAVFALTCITLSVSLLLPAVCGGLAGAFIGAATAEQSRPPLLRLFTDVGDYTTGHFKRDPIEDEIAAVKENLRRIAAGEEPLANDAPDPVAETGFPADATPELSRQEPTDPATSEPLEQIPARLDDVPLRTIVLASADCVAETKALLDALDESGLADILAVDVLTDAQPETTRSSYWLERWRSTEYFIVLLNRGLIATPTHGAVSEVFGQVEWNYERTAIPVMLEELENSPSVITQAIQASPSGGLPIADWPILPNAWLNVVQSPRENLLLRFSDKLHKYHEKHLADEIKAKIGDRPIGWEEHSDILQRMQGISYNVLDLPYPYRRWGFDFKLRPWLLWCGVAAIVFAAFASNASRLSAWESFMHLALLPTLTLLPILSILAVLDDVDRITWISPYRWGEHPLADLLFGTSHVGDHEAQWARRRLIFAICKVAGVLVSAASFIGLLVVVSSRPGAWTMGAAGVGSLIGILVGSLAYLASCRRMPRVLIKRSIPSHRDTFWRWHRGRLEMHSSRMDHSRKDEGVIGDIESHESPLIRGYSESLQLSIVDLVRAAAEVTLLFAAALLIAGGLHAVGAPGVVAALSILAITSFGLAMLGQLLYPRHSFEPRLSYLKRMALGSLNNLPGLRAAAGCLALAGLLYVAGGARTFSMAMQIAIPVAFWVFAFLSRCRQLLIRSSGSNWRNR